MTVTLRPATPRDAPACTALDQRCFAPHIAYDAPIFEDLCRTAAVMIIAESDDRMVGFVAADAAPDAPTGLIITVDVDPAWRGQGIGTALLRAAHEQLRAAGVTTVYLHVAVEQRDAQRLYKRLGYSTVGRLRDYYGPTLDAFLMARPAAREDD
jgi:ribosomal-protein-alanine N-acetyltransferase